MITPDKTTYGDKTTIKRDLAEIQEWLRKYPNGAVIIKGSNGAQLYVKLVDGKLKFIERT